MRSTPAISSSTKTRAAPRTDRYFTETLGALLRRRIRGRFAARGERRLGLPALDGLFAPGTLPDFSSREVEVLQWAALGKTDWEIGQLLREGIDFLRGRAYEDPLNEGRLGGAGLDVTDPEPLPIG